MSQTRFIPRPLGLILLGALGLAGCLDLDAVLHNPVPCSAVGPDTCEAKAGGWNAICATCGEPYNFEQDYDWIPGTLEAGASVRPIPNTSVVNASIPTQDGAGFLDLYFIPAHGEDAAAAQVTVVYSHGNYAGIEHYLPRVRFLYEAGYNVLVWDYRGYGKSLPASPPAAPAFLEDARDIGQRARSYAPDPSKILVYGYSLGAIPAVEMALDGDPCALFLESPLTSVNAMMRASTGLDLPGAFLSQGQYENDQKIKGYPGPLLVMAGDADQLFPPEDTQALYENAPGPKELWVLPGVGHGIGGGGVPEAGLAAYEARMAAFLDASGACR